MRRFPAPATLLACAALAAAPAHALAQGGAGDDQYQDPFGGTSTTGSSSSGSGRTGSTGSTAPLTTRPSTNLSATGSTGSSSTTGTSTGSTTSTTTNPSATGSLPNTGLDVPGIAALGLGLLVTGIGLRLRTVDDRLF